MLMPKRTKYRKVMKGRNRGKSYRANTLAYGKQLIDDFNLDEATRVYFGPVDIERMRVRLVNDKGYTVNLNGNDWSFTLTATALYQY